MRRKTKGKGRRKRTVTIRSTEMSIRVWGPNALRCAPDWALESLYEIDVEDEMYRKHPLPDNERYVRVGTYWYIKDKMDRVSEYSYDYKSDHAEDDPWTEEDEKLNMISIRSSLRHKKYRLINRQAPNLKEMVEAMAQKQ
eukprot:TRINITY_DN2255_c0_g1_i2.p1 TRINITY_DN2255_c0_g1~~TRINITY_DN2255_c0_g1_i2.p1  ORF type:complete len:140 (-),score=19.70 TRINITY_DN2255_c0_g1_i2:44-463(-)